MRRLNLLKIRWHGHSCFEITNEVVVVTDPHDGKSIGIPTPSVQGDIILISHDHYDHNSAKSVERESSKIITDERKRNISNIEIKGIKTFHDKHRRGQLYVPCGILRVAPPRRGVQGQHVRHSRAPHTGTTE